MYRMGLMAIMLILGAGRAAADEATAADAGGLLGWRGTLDLGYLASSGNTETQTLNFAAEANRTFGQWTHNLYAQAVNSSDSGARSAERYLLGYKLDRALTEHSYVFGRVETERDRFGGVLDRQHISAGYGRKLLTGPEHVLSIELGAGFNDLEFSDATTSSEMLISLVGDYSWAATSTTTLTQRLRYDAGEANDYAESESTVSVAISTRLALSVSYLVKYNSTVPAGVETTDSYMAVGLSISF